MEMRVRYVNSAGRKRNKILDAVKNMKGDGKFGIV
jgi:hypothetical protein